MPQATLYDLSKIIEMSRNNNDFVKKMVQLTVSEFTNSMAKINEAYKSGDFENLKYYSHRMKPSILNLEIKELKQEIRQIEAYALNGVKTPELTNLINHLDKIINIVIGQLKTDYKL